MTEQTMQAAAAVKKRTKIAWKELLMKLVFILAAILFVAAVLTICVFIFVTPSTNDVMFSPNSFTISSFGTPQSSKTS